MTVTTKSLRQEFPLERLSPDYFESVLPGPRCGSPDFFYDARVVTESGKTYDSQHPPADSCTNLNAAKGGGCAGDNDLHFEKVGLYCEVPPDTLLLDVWLPFERDETLTIERLAEGGPVSVAVVTPVPSEAKYGPIRVPIDVRGLPSGDVLLRARLTSGSGELIATDEHTIPIDTMPPGAEVLLPAEDGQLCLSPDPTTGREVGSFLVRVQDVARTVKLGSAEFRYEDGAWLPFTPLCLDGSACGGGEPEIPAFPILPTGVPRRIGWDATGRVDGDYAVRFVFCDEDGNETAVERRFSLHREPPVVLLVGLLPTSGIFSPNGDGRSDIGAVTVRTYQATRLSAVVRAGRDTGPVVRVLPVIDPALPGDHAIEWDGRDSSGAVVPDGPYAVVVSVQDPCGGTDRLASTLVVDNTPPAAVISVPAENDVVNASLDVLGEATDAHFASYELMYGAGAAPVEWLPIATGASAVRAGGRLGRWHTPAAEDVYTLRLVAWDQAENVTESLVRVNVTDTPYLKRLSVEPAIFSPNGDGRRDTTAIEYELLAAARVTLDVLTRQGVVVRTFVPAQEQGVGTHLYIWDGLADAGADAPDGDYDVRIRAGSPTGTGASQQDMAAVIVDRMPPAVTIVRPLADVFLTRAEHVRGSIEDLHLSSYSLWAVSSTGPDGGLPIGSGAQNRQDADLAALSWLADGAYRLRVRASDLAENETTVEVPFNVDALPPRVAFEIPAPNAILDQANPIDVRGLVVDANLDHHTLSFGPGAAPAVFDLIARGVTGGESIALAAWNASGLPDGEYTLELEGVDRAAQSSQTLRMVILDGTPPQAVIAAPGEGSWVTKPRPIVGTAWDQNLESWSLDAAPGDAGAAFEWSALASGTDGVDGDLTTWDPLPPDGVYTLRLTVRDKAGHVSKALRTVKVDQTPPAPPTGLVGKVIAVDRDAMTATIQLTWNPNTEPDLAGYEVSRQSGELLTPEVITVTVHDDPGRPEGIHPYEVVALDLAGNVSLPASTKVKVDLTPPLVAILRPEAGAVVSGTVEIRGTAWSATDFKEYRLFIGASETPTSWTQLAHSTLPVVAGLLGTWDALEDGPYVIALEAEDLDGNQARVTSPLVVDTLPPEPPVLVSVDNTPEVTSLTSTWLASPSPDVAGYLLYRDGRLANAPGIVIGDLREFMIPGLTYPDPDLPDGRYCYRVVAMDHAGNTSDPSNEICVSLDNRAPRATIVDPLEGTRFEYPIRVVADSPDTDIASVQFQIKPHAGSTWDNLNAPDPAATYETTLDPISLELGDYDLRAVATDEGGRTDAEPPSITVTYGDTKPPAIPTGLVAHVDGRQVHLTWNANTEDDLAGYHVFRDGERITTTPVPEPAYDEDRDPGEYEYAVTAIDEDDNESGPSAPARAVVYQVSLEPPAWPVVLEQTVTLHGAGARPDTTIQILSGDTVLAEIPASASEFVVADLPLLVDGNIVRARGIDAAGNRSIPSEDVVVIRNVPPAPVTGLAADVVDHDVALTWDASTDADRHGHFLRRDETALTLSSRVGDGYAWADSTYSYCVSGGRYVYCDATYAVDGNPATSWVPYPYGDPGTWTVTFPTALVDRVNVRFGSSSFGASDVVANYRIEVAWEGRYVPVIRVRGNTQSVVEHVFPMPFAADSLRVVVDTAASPYAGLAEVEVSKVDVLAADVTTYQDASVPDGYRNYDVRAMDRYGAESEPATLRVPVGDVEPPAAPIELVATVVAHDVRLTWTANSEPDLGEYRVSRDGEQIGTSPAAEYLDAGRPNGQYTYVVRAVDHVGNESEPSNEAVAVVAVVLAPPVLRGAAQPDGTNALDWDHPGAAGFTVQRALVSGGPHEDLAETGDVRAYVDEAVRDGTEYFYVARAFDAFGSESLPSNEVAIRTQRTELAAPEIFFPTDAAHPVTIEATRTDVQGRAEAGTLVALDVNGEAAGYAPTLSAFVESGRTPLESGNRDVAFSRDARRAAYQLQYVNSSYGGISYVYDEIRVVDRVTGVSDQIRHDGSSELYAPQLSPDGARLAYRAYVWDAAYGYGYRLFVLDLATRGLTGFASADGYIEAHGWAPDGERLAVALAASGSTDQSLVEIWDHKTGGRRTLVGAGEIPYIQSIEWSPDSTRLAVVVSASTQEIRLVDAQSGTQTTLASGGDASWSSDGQRLTFAANDGSIVVRNLATGDARTVVGAGSGAASPRLDRTGRWLSYRSGYCPETIWMLDMAANEQHGIDVGMPSDQYCYSSATAWTPEGRLAVSFADDHIGVFGVEDGFFNFPAVALAPGENVFVARSLDLAAGLVSPDSEPVRVTVAESVFPDLEVTAASLLTFPAVPVVGRATNVSARVANVGEVDASDVDVALTVSDSAGRTVLRHDTTVAEIGASASASVSAAWTPSAAGTYSIEVVVDRARRIAEMREDNNSAARAFEVTAVSGVVAADIAADRSVYLASSPATVSVSLLNAGPAVGGTLRTTVEDAAGALVALLDERAVSLDYGQSLAFALPWNTGRSYAGDYAFRVRLVSSDTTATLATDAWPFAITPDLTLAARLVPRQTRITSGATAVLDARIENRGTNAPLLGGLARLRMRAAGTTVPVLFEATLPLSTLLPGGLFTSVFDWPATVPAGQYDAELTVFRAGEPVLVTAHASIEVVTDEVSLVGSLALSPPDILTGEGTDAEVTLTNRSSVAASGLLVAVEVADGPTAAVLVRTTLTLDLAAGETRTTSVQLDTSSLVPGRYPVFLKAGEPSKTLDRVILGVHGAITPPTIYSPPDGSKVATSHPDLVVSNAESAADAPLSYEFEIYANTELTAPLPGARDIPEGVDRTAWTVVTNLTENWTYYWRVRASDGFSTSAWTGVARFTVDAEHVPPMAPVPESPVPGEHVTSLQPFLVVRNAIDPDSPVLTYDFRLATDPEMTTILASATDLASGAAYTSWQVPMTLEENATYYWCARARDESSDSPWSSVVSFVVDTVNESPTAPVPVRPSFGARLTALTTTLVVANARDPEGQPLAYRFQIDSAPSFDTPTLQQASSIAEGPVETSWTPPSGLVDHTTYYWRAAASDGVTFGPWGASEFFVNLANEPPAAPVPIAPADGEIVTTLTPELRVRNATDPDGDELSYDFRVMDEDDREVASVTGVEEGAFETAWVVLSPLVENGSYAWTARAQDPELPGPWTEPWHFRVNAEQQPPTAPTLVAPPEGSVIDTRRPELVVGNATSPEGLPLSLQLRAVERGGRRDADTHRARERHRRGFRDHDLDAFGGSGGRLVQLDGPGPGSVSLWPVDGGRPLPRGDRSASLAADGSDGGAGRHTGESLLARQPGA